MQSVKVISDCFAAHTSPDVSLRLKKKALFTEYSSAQIYKVLCQDTETINQTQEINSYCINDELKFIDVQEQDCLPALVGGWGGRNFVGLL